MKFLRLRSLALILFFLGLFGCSQQSEPALLESEELARLQKIIKKEAAEGKIVDLDFVLLSGTNLVFEAYVRDGKLLESKPTPPSLFRLASMSKPITSVGALILVEQGKLGLDDPVSDYLPEFDNLKVWIADSDPDDVPESGALSNLEKASPMLVRHLLTHTSGITYTHSGETPLNQAYKRLGITNGAIQTPETLNSFVNKLSTLPLKFQPGEKWEYGLSTDVLGRVIEVASGQPLDQFLKANIFDPLGMADTHFFLPEEKVDRLLPLYTRKEDGTFVPLATGTQNAGSIEFSMDYPFKGPRTFFSGGGGMVSSLEDYSRFLAFLANFEGYQGPSILGEKLISEMVSGQLGEIEMGIPGYTFGYGIGVRDNVGEASTLGEPGEFSWSGLFFTTFWVDPENEITGLFFSQVQPDKRTDLFVRLKNSVYLLGE